MLLGILLLSLLFLYKSSNLLLSLLILEIMRFMLIYFVSVNLSFTLFSDFYLLLLFSVFVMEGVLGLSGLILMVRFTGSDYVKRSRTLKC